MTADPDMTAYGGSKRRGIIRRVDIRLSMDALASEMFCTFHGFTGEEREYILKDWGSRSYTDRQRWRAAALCAIETVRKAVVEGARVETA